MAKDFVKLFSESGEARKYFSDATGGAAWVDNICNELVTELKKKHIYIVTDDPLVDMIDKMFAIQKVQGLTIWRASDIPGAFQANYAWGNISTWDTCVVFGAGDAVTTAVGRALARQC